MVFSSTVDLTYLTATYLKDMYLIGLTLLGADGQELPDSVFLAHIDQAFGKLEQLTNVDVLSHAYTAETHDYHVSDYMKYGFLQLFHVPVQSVSEVRAVYPAGQTIQTFPTEWIRLNGNHGQIHLVPTSGTLSQVIIGQGADYLPLIYSGLGYLPALWEVDYISGIDPTKVPAVIVEAVCKIACIELLQKLSDTITPLGVQSQSLSVDGLSQSKGYMVPAFKGRIDAYKGDLGLSGQPGQDNAGGLLAQIRRDYLGINLASL